MTSFRSLSRMQRVAWIGASVLFGVLCITPAIFIRLDPSVTFRGIEMQGTDAEVHYAARVQEIRDGFPAASNVFYADPKDQPYLQPPLPEWIVAQLGNLFRLDTPRALLLSQFLFGTGVFFVMVGCFATLTRRFWWSLAGTTVMLFIGYVFSGPSLLLDLVHDTAGGIEFLTFARPINPQWSGVLFFGALWALASWVRTASPRTLIVTGMLTAFSFYSYVYVWTLLGVIFAMMTVRYGVRREFSRVKALILLAISIGIAAAPYLWNVWNAAHHSFYAETSMRLGLVSSHRPELGIMVIIFLIIAIVARKRFTDMAWLVTAFAIASVIVLNQQLLTGKVIVASHYHWYFIKPTVIILSIIIAGSWMWDRVGNHVRALVYPLPLAIAGLMIAGGMGGLYQWRSYEAVRPLWAAQQDTAGALRFLRGQIPPGQPVYARGFIRELIPVYTSADVAWSTNAYAYLSSDVRARNAYFLDLWMDGVSSDEATATFSTTRRAELSSRIHAIYYREAMKRQDAIPDDEVARHAEAYRAFRTFSVDQRLEVQPVRIVVLSRAEAASAAGKAMKERSFLLYTDEAFEIRSFGEH